jgi:hypothetical protein
MPDFFPWIIFGHGIGRVYLEAISKLGFSVEIKTRPRINPPRLLTGSSTRILKYVEDLRRGRNADIGRKGFFEMASIFHLLYVTLFAVHYFSL